jgi:hypothetical protein
MPLFDADFAAVDGMFDEVFGTEDVIIEEADGTQHTFAATVADETAEQRQTDMGTETIVARDVVIPISARGREHDGAPEILNLRGVVIVNEIRYAIEQVLHSRSGMALFKTRRVSVAEKARDTYRRRNP